MPDHQDLRAYLLETEALTSWRPQQWQTDWLEGPFFRRQQAEEDRRGRDTNARLTPRTEAPRRPESCDNSPGGESRPVNRPSETGESVPERISVNVSLPTSALRSVPRPVRTCPRCQVSLPLTSEYFYIRPTGRAEYCLDCHGEYYRGRAARRRSGRPAALRFGVEIEYTNAPSFNVVATACAEHGLDCRETPYTHAVTRYWKVLGDSSVSNGGELVSPPLRMDDRGVEQIHKACRALRSVEAVSSRACGLHVHLEVRGYDAPRIGRIFRMWHNNQGVIDRLVSRSRRGSRWCADLTAEDVERVEGMPDATDYSARMYLGGLDRYRNLNGTSYPKYGTLEVRMHQGTVVPEKIISWARLCRSLFTMAADGDVTGRGTLDDLLDAADQHGLTPESHAYLRRRAAQIATRERSDTRTAEERTTQQRFAAAQAADAHQAVARFTQQLDSAQRTLAPA